MTQSKNSLAWQKLVEQFNILDHVEQHGSFVISSSQINTVRESRLMAKFDHSVNLPDIFKEHGLSILPISRSQYIIGHFDTHMPVEYDTSLEPLASNLPTGLESIDQVDLYSEASVLLYAFNTGIINDVVGENTSFTVMGRMTTGDFDFQIRHSQTDSNENIHVSHAQCEIDAGFEGESRFLIVEAKNYAIDDFLIRQLYYPYRLWREKVRKQVVPALMTFSNDVITFFVFEFDELAHYNSLRLVSQMNYAISPEVVTHDDLSNLLMNVRITPDDLSVPFPQANRFERIVDLVTLLRGRDMTSEAITRNYQFDGRQTEYYTNAARYLALVDKKNAEHTGGVRYSLSSEGIALVRARHKAKLVGLMKLMLAHGVFNQALRSHLENGHPLSKPELTELILAQRPDLNRTTAERRTGTVGAWLNWILLQVAD